MDKQTRVYSYNGILFSNKKNELLIYTTIWVNLKNIMLNKRSQTEKNTYCMKYKNRYYWCMLTEIKKQLPGRRGSVVQFSHSVVSNSLWPHGPQHARLPCPSLTPRIESNSCPSSRWCHPTISSSVIPFSSQLQSFPASGSFPISQFFTSGGQSIGVSASASVLPMNVQDWFPLGLTGSPCSPRDSEESSPTPQFKSISSSVLSFLYGPLSHPYMTTGKP